MTSPKVLIVEDDKNLGAGIHKFIQGEGLDAHLACNLAQAREQMDQLWDIVVLDWMLPDGQGLDFLREVKKQHPHLPVIMLTARTELIDKVLGLETGANDYVTKPFEPRELLARIRVQLRLAKQKDHPRRSEPLEQEASDEGKMVVGDLVIDTQQREVQFSGEEIVLTKMEFELLKLLASSPNRAFSREEILNKVWGYDNFPTTRTVDTHVLQLRQKLSDNLIETIRGIGYRLRH